MSVCEGQRYAWQGRTLRVMHVLHSPKNGAWVYLEVSGSVGPSWRKYWKLPLPTTAKLLGGVVLSDDWQRTEMTKLVDIAGGVA